MANDEFVEGVQPQAVEDQWEAALEKSGKELPPGVEKMTEFYIGLQPIGTPEQVLDLCRRYEAVGVDQVICYVQFGYLPHRSVMRTIELLGTHVIPELDK